MRIQNKMLGVLLISFLPFTAFGYETCAEKVRAQYKHAVIGQVAASPVWAASVAAIAVDGLGILPLMGLAVTADATNKLRKFARILEAATLEHSNSSTPKSMLRMDKIFRLSFWVDKKERAKIEEQRARDGRLFANAEWEKLKPMTYTRADVVSVLHRLNTEPQLRKKCLRMKTRYTWFGGFQGLQMFSTEEDFAQFEAFLN